MKMKTKLIKKRQAKNSERGFYFQDIELLNTEFKPGKRFSYHIDCNYVVEVKNKKLVIVPSENGNMVSKREIKNGYKSVIDIRKKSTLSAFRGVDKLQIEIHNDKITVSGYEETEENTLFKTMLQSLKKRTASLFKRSASVIDINGILKVKKKVEVTFSKKELEEAVGFEQLSLFETYLENETSDAPEHVKRRVRSAKIPLLVASVFAGAGIMDLGFKEAGFDIEFALEYDKDAVETYRHNLGNHIVHEDINQFNFKRLLQLIATVYIGGSPCQDFSNANRKTRFLDSEKNKLVKKYIEGVKALPNCQVFVLENVPQILTAGNGQFKDEIFNELSDFEITSGIINAADMGTAQKRKRAIFIGSKIGKIELPKPLLTPEEYVTVGEAFEGLHDGIPNFNDYSKPKELTKKRMEFVKPGENWEVLPDELRTEKMREGTTQSSIYRRLEWDKPSITIPNPRKSNIMPPEGNRILSLRECARLFGVPDSFEFKGKLGAMQQQIANAVPVQLAKSVALAVKNAIIQYNLRNGHQRLELI